MTRKRKRRGGGWAAFWRMLGSLTLAVKEARSPSHKPARSSGARKPRRSPRPPRELGQKPVEWDLDQDEPEPADEQDAPAGADPAPAT